MSIYPEQYNGAIALANGGNNAYFTAGNNLIEIGTIPSQNSQITGFVQVSNLPYNLTGLSMTANGLGAYAIDNNGNIFYANFQSSSGSLISASTPYQNFGNIATSTDGNYLYSSDGFYDLLNTQSSVTSNQLPYSVFANIPGRLTLATTYTSPVLSCQNQDNSYILSAFIY